MSVEGDLLHRGQHGEEGEKSLEVPKGVAEVVERDKAEAVNSYGENIDGAQRSHWATEYLVAKNEIFHVVNSCAFWSSGIVLRLCKIVKYFRG